MTTYAELLYGLPAGSDRLAYALYGLPECGHGACDVSVFCRNPLHPGPCKGWKRTLGTVAPGVLREIEARRIGQAEERRKAAVKRHEDAGRRVPARLKKPITPKDVAADPNVAKPGKLEVPTSKEIDTKIAARRAAVAEIGTIKFLGKSAAKRLEVYRQVTPADVKSMPDAQRTALAGDLGMMATKMRTAAQRNEAKAIASRLGQGVGRDADGDGLKGEGEYEKKGRKPAAKKAVTGEKKANPDEPDPSDGHPVKLRKETRALVAAAEELLPKTDVEWANLHSEEGALERKIDRDVQDAFQRWARDLVALNDAEDQHFEGLLGPGKTAFDATSEQVRAWRSSKGYKTLSDMADSSKASWASMKDHRDETDADIAAAGGVRPDGRLPQQLRHLEEYYLPSKERVSKYDLDPNGIKLPNAELVKMQEAVQAAGAALHKDIQASFHADAEWLRLKDEWLQAIRQSTNGATYSERDRGRLETQRLRYERGRREQQMVIDALSQIRTMGWPDGRAHKSAKPINSHTEQVQARLDRKADIDFARKDWEEQLTTAEGVYPEDWNRRSGDAPLYIVSSDRAWHSSIGSDWRAGDPIKQATALSMDKSTDPKEWYDGAFKTSAHEVTAHELGHRMEEQIPGLKALEFAYVRSRTTHNGVVEEAVKLQELVGGGYRDNEVTMPDKFPDAYTGKTYEFFGASDPVNTNWEAFQVGIQQTFGRGSRKYGDDTLEAFTLGVLATLGRRS